LLENSAIILQARMGSKRLPGKVVKRILNKPMIQWIIERLRKVNLVRNIIVATSTLPSERPLIQVVRSLRVPVFRGSEEDVLDRYYQCAKKFRLQHIIRATADNPFVDPVECDRLVDLYLNKQVDYACAFPEFGSGFPVGVGLEIFNFASLKRSWREATEARHREHVNEYIQENGRLFKKVVLKAKRSKLAPQLTLTVDTKAQFKQAEKIYTKYFSDRNKGIVSLEWVIRQFKRENMPLHIR
jgi:spore coat polysaccharide biosynthesis protein SpsF